MTHSYGGTIKTRLRKKLPNARKYFTKTRLSTLRMKIVGNGGDLGIAYQEDEINHNREGRVSFN
jgi:hypothetical protein